MSARSVIASIRERDWISVVIEVLVVVVGVFIGLQASNWNEDRETDRRAAVFAERLKADLRAEAWGYEMQIGYYGAVVSGARQAADALSGKSALSDEALLIAAYRATQYNGNIRRRATFDELTSTGEIGLIRDAHTRDLAVRLYNFPSLEEIVEEAKHSEYRHWFRMHMPHEVQLALAERCGDRVVEVGDYSAIATSLDHPCALDLPPQAIADAANTLRTDPQVLPLLRLRIADVQTSLENLTVYNRDIREDLRAVAGKRRITGK